jgi:putative ABC transport system substrate-binding protein
MRRREFITALGGAAASMFSARAQSATRIPRIGLLDYTAREAGRLRLWDAFRQRMRELGYAEGGTVVFEQRWTEGKAEGKADRAKVLAAELVNLPVEIIVTASTPATQAAKGATSTIPIVMTGTTDSVAQGLVASLNRPGGNVTGLTLLSSDVSAKILELLREAVPQASRIVMIWEGGNEGTRIAVRNAQSAAQTLGISLQSLTVGGADEFDGAFASMVRDRAAAVIVGGSALFFAERTRLIDLAAKHRLPAIFNERSYVQAGGFMSYGSDFAEGFRRAADYVDKILNGAKPADLPIEQPTKFELVINLKTAKALGLEMPTSILLRADEIIE